MVKIVLSGLLGVTNELPGLLEVTVVLPGFIGGQHWVARFVGGHRWVGFCADSSSASLFVCYGDVAAQTLVHARSCSWLSAWRRV